MQPFEIRRKMSASPQNCGQLIFSTISSSLQLLNISVCVNDDLARSTSLSSVNHDPAVFLTTARVTKIVLAVFTSSCGLHHQYIYSIIDSCEFLDLFSNQPMQIKLIKITIENCYDT
jgi:hypothetical protein